MDWRVHLGELQYVSQNHSSQLSLKTSLGDCQQTNLNFLCLYKTFSLVKGTILTNTSSLTFLATAEVLLALKLVFSASFCLAVLAFSMNFVVFIESDVFMAHFQIKPSVLAVDSVLRQ